MGVPDSTCSGKGWSGGRSCPTGIWLVLISSRVLPGSGIKRDQGCLFTFFSPFWPKDVKTKPLLCLPPPSFLPPPLLSLISLTTENPTRETEGFCRSPFHFHHSPGVTLHALSPGPSISRAQGHRFRQVMSDGSYYPYWQRRKLRHGEGRSP